MAEKGDEAKVADEKAAAAAEQAASQKAAEKRQAAQEKAQDLKQVPADAPPPQQKTSGGETQYSVERLISDAGGFLGVPPYVAAAALHDVTEGFLSTDDAKKRVEKYLG